MAENATEWSRIAVYTNNPDYFTILKHILNGAGFSALLCNRKIWKKNCQFAELRASSWTQKSTMLSAFVG